ncbi:MAG: glycosyltransferase family 39 protein [Candidatus Melainabacteria bacterium]|nr:glycosyltransferase family 39 protein [Candidatus Melainabacteria bacterium]
MASWIKKHRDTLLVAFLWSLVGAGIVFRLINPFFNNPNDFLQSDPLRHFLSARECLPTIHENWTACEIIDPLGYQFWLTTILRITAADRVATAIYAGALSILNTWFWYQWMKLCVGNKNLALAGYAVLSVLPDWTRVFQYYLQETLVLPLVGLSLWLSWATMKNPSSAKYVGTGLAWGCALLTKITALPMATVVFAWMIFKNSPNLRKPDLRNLKLPLVALAICLVVYALGPIKIFNRIHAFVLIPGGDYHRACYESGNDNMKCTFKFQDIRQGNQVYEIEAGPPSLDLRLPVPFEWKTTRKGLCLTEADFTASPFNYYPPSRMSFQDRLHYTWENIIYFFFGLSWPENTDTRYFGIFCEMMKSSRFIWLPITLAIIFLIVKKRRVDIMSVLFLVSLSFFMLQQSVIMEARYKKAWEGIAVATLFALLANRKIRNKERTSELS